MNADIGISNVTLKTERLILRPWSLDDPADFNEYASINGVRQMAGWLPHKDIGESREARTNEESSILRHRRSPQF